MKNNMFSIEDAAQDLFKKSATASYDDLFNQAMEGYEDILNNTEDDEIHFATESVRDEKDAEALLVLTNLAMQQTFESLETEESEVSEEADDAGKMAKVKAALKKMWEKILAAIQKLGQAIANMLKRIQVAVSGPIIKAQAEFYKKNAGDTAKIEGAKDTIKVRPLKVPASKFIAEVIKKGTALSGIVGKYVDEITKFANATITDEMTFMQAFKTGMTNAKIGALNAVKAADLGTESDISPAQEIINTEFYAGTEVKDVPAGGYIKSAGGFSLLKDDGGLKNMFKTGKETMVINKSLFALAKKEASKSNNKEALPAVQFAQRLNNAQFQLIVSTFTAVMSVRSKVQAAAKAALKGEAAPAEPPKQVEPPKGE